MKGKDRGKKDRKSSDQRRFERQEENKGQGMVINEACMCSRVVV